MDIKIIIAIVSALTGCISGVFALVGFIQKRSAEQKQLEILAQIEKLEGFAAPKDLRDSEMDSKRAGLTVEARRELDFWYGELDKLLDKRRIARMPDTEKEMVWAKSFFLLHIPRSWKEGIANAAFYCACTFTVGMFYLVGYDFQEHRFSIIVMLVALKYPLALIDLLRPMLLTYFARTWARFERKKTFPSEDCQRKLWRRLLFVDIPESRRELLARTLFLFRIFSLVTGRILASQPFGQAMAKEFDKHPSPLPALFLSAMFYANLLAPLILYAWAYVEGELSVTNVTRISARRKLRFLYSPKDILSRLLFILAAIYMTFAIVDIASDYYTVTPALLSVISDQDNISDEEVAEVRPLVYVIGSIEFPLIFLLDYGALLYAIHRLVLYRYVAVRKMEERKEFGLAQIHSEE